MKKIITIAILVSLISANPSCKNNTGKLGNGKRSLNGLVKALSESLVSGDRGAFVKHMLTKKEFIQNIFSHLPEKKAGMRAVDYWGLILPGLIKGIKRSFSDFNSAKIIEIGNPKIVKKYGPVTVYLDIPVVFKLKNKKIVKTKKLFKAIVEKDGIYKLFNITYENIEW